MPDLNGSLTLQSPSARRGTSASRVLAACLAVPGLAACHNVDSTAPLTVSAVTVLSGGSTVTFSDDASGSLTATTVTTDAFGIATDVLTLGPNAGPDDVTASIDTPSGPVTATLHETAM